MHGLDALVDLAQFLMNFFDFLLVLVDALLDLGLRLVLVELELEAFQLQLVVLSLFGQRERLFGVLVDFLLQELNRGPVLLFSVDVALLLGYEVVSELVRFFALIFVLRQHFGVLGGPVLGAHFDREVFVLNAAVLHEFG